MLNHMYVRWCHYLHFMNCIAPAREWPKDPFYSVERDDEFKFYIHTLIWSVQWVQTDLNTFILTLGLLRYTISLGSKVNTAWFRTTTSWHYICNRSFVFTDVLTTKELCLYSTHTQGWWLWQIDSCVVRVGDYGYRSLFTNRYHPNKHWD